jgi:LmbE family N-acetylglucosaminyl deacetylase
MRAHFGSLAGKRNVLTMQTALNVSPHPDDEVLGPGALLLLLRDAGWCITNLTCSLGRPSQRERRNAELEEATRRMNIQSRLCEPVLSISARDDLAVAEVHLASLLEGEFRNNHIDLVIGPHPYDGHHAHELVGRSIRHALEVTDRSIPWWAWGLWADLTQPTLYVPFDQHRLDEVSYVLSAYSGECIRNDYRRLLPARATANAILGSERIFGFGSEKVSQLPYAELFTEYHFDREWRRGEARVMDVSDPLLRQGVRR